MSKLKFTLRVNDILTKMGLSEELTPALVDAYTEPWRTHHNTNRVLSLLELAELFRRELDARSFHKLQCMVIYQDVVYKINREVGYNEEASAAWAKRDLLPFFPATFVTDVQFGIYATITHMPGNAEDRLHKVIAVLLDLDLHYLGADPEAFALTYKEIWGEHQPKYTREEFDIAHIFWAKHFLESRHHIFHTAIFSPLEEKAQKNLTDLAEGKLCA